MKTLLATLISRLHAREASLRNGRCHRKDLVALNAAMGRAWSFVRSYPKADDERVRNWCLAHYDDIALIVTGNTPGVLARLVKDQFTPKNAAV